MRTRYNDDDDDNYDSSRGHRKDTTQCKLLSSIVLASHAAFKKVFYVKWCSMTTSTRGGTTIFLVLVLLLLLLVTTSSDYFLGNRSIVLLLQKAPHDATAQKKKMHDNKKSMLDDNASLLLPAPSSLFAAAPSIDFFDCHRSDSLCTFFQPRHFFQNGSGNNFDFDRLGGANPNLPACTALSWWWWWRWSNSSSTLASSSSSSSSFLSSSILSSSLVSPMTNGNTTNKSSYYGNYWHNLSFIHIHKCGGTTIHATMRALQKQIILQSQVYSSSSSSSSSLNISCTVDTYKYSIGGGSRRQKQTNDQKRWAHIRAIARAQRQQQQQQLSSTLSPSLSLLFPVFTIVRDPVDRFLSAFQQVMHYNDDLRSACLKPSSAKATIQCVIQYVAFRQTTKDGGPGLDVHLVPMAMHLRLFHETDITISVFHLQDINAISQYLHLGDSSPFPFSSGQTNNSSTVVGRSASVVIKHMHDRSQVKFATSKILATLSVKDCDAKMLQDICDMYAVDVAMMHTLGYETPYCTFAPSSS